MKLSKNVIPLNYEIHIEPSLIESTFYGEALIAIEIQQTTNEITLNTVDLEIISARLIRGSNRIEDVLSKNIINNPEKEITSFIFISDIIGKGTLSIVYKGKITNNLKGLYQSKCIDKNGKVQLAGVTQMVPTDARRCFPCWDEPNFKATFDITLKVSKSQLALSNMPVKSFKEYADGQDSYTFERTPVMSTYLVAIVVGFYDYVENKNNGILVRVYTPTGKSEQGLFALDVARKSLTFYRNYFNIAYPLPKLDLIAIADLSYGAMENWGLITYRENRLLIDPENTSTYTKQQTALTVGHEIAHQWFGNLVTMDWWTDLWLNEGYASYLQCLSIDNFFPEYNIWTQFVHSTHAAALELDALKNSHPIEVPIQNPGEVFEIFDAISYNKGASVIRMLVDYIGDAKFRKGMHSYLNRFQYKNATTDDLWRALEEASSMPVNEVMSTWTKQMGYPLITVTRRLSDQSGGTILTISQSKFNSDGSITKNCQWMVPISICTSSDPTHQLQKFLLKTSSTEVYLENTKPSQWVKINVGTIGFYRTKYTDEMLEQFLSDIQNKRMPPSDRLGLLDDLFALSKSGNTSTVSLLKFLKAFENETDYNVWSSINTILVHLEKILEYTTYLPNFKKYQREFLANIRKAAKWEPILHESHEDGLLRTLILGRLTNIGDEKFVEEALNKFDKHISKQVLVPADYRHICYSVAIRSRGRDGYEKLLECYKSTDFVEEKHRIISTLGCTSDVELAKDILDFYMSDDVRLGDKISGIVSLSQTKLGREIAWNYMKNNWNHISALFGSASSLLPRLVKQSLENFSSRDVAEDISAFFCKNDFGIERSLQQALENIQLNEAWLNRDKESLGNYLIRWK